jgi:hypothetical protein
MPYDGAVTRVVRFKFRASTSGVEGTTRCVTKSIEQVRCGRCLDRRHERQTKSRSDLGRRRVVNSMLEAKSKVELASHASSPNPESTYHNLTTK